ncbi:MAG TPA: AAA family ATPase [Bryobacteraceae bacterium]|nr:AAA family ATPase [Bryobacteraceae bacterium]
MKRVFDNRSICTPTHPQPVTTHGDGLAAVPASQESRAARMIREVFESGRPLTYIRSAEEQRLGKMLGEVAHGKLAAKPLPVWTWSLTEGMRHEDQAPEPGTHAPRGALDFIVAYRGEAIFHLKDFHEPLRESSETRRRLRDVYESCLNHQKFVVITSPVRFVPEELERSIIFLELRPPDVIELVDFLRSETSGATEEVLNQIARALVGLTLDEARYALRRALAVSPVLSSESLPAVLEEKRLLVNRTGYIEYIAGGTDLSEVGGLDGLKKWLIERRKLFQLRDSLSAEIVPKGVLIMGIPGCGKSLTVKAIASSFQLPLYRVDMIEIFSGRHGKPEGAFVQACRMLEEMAPAVLWFDEIEMGITSTDSGGEQGRIFAFFLTWMQEKTRGLFVAATANRIDLLPAEMIRKGRFDEVFFVDLPLPEEQAEIFKIHLTRRGVNISDFKLEDLLEFTAGWTGAEIEQCVISAITRARLEEREVTQHDLIGVAVKLVPLSRTMKEQISHIRGWAFERAVRATPQGIRR